MKIIKFGAEWCVACKAIQPILDDVAGSNPDVNFISIDVDKEEYSDDVIKYKIRSLPTVVFVGSDEVELDRFVGVKSKKYIQDIINSKK